MYIKPLSAIIDSHSIMHHSFADDLQLQMSAPPERIYELLHSMQSCICDVKAWATANIHFDDNNWSQAKLPVRYGGLGLRTAADLALPAFLSSRAASISLVNDVRSVYID